MPTAPGPDQGPEGLEAGSGTRRIGEEEGPLPEALAGHRVVGLGIDREQQAGLSRALVDPLHHHQDVPIGVRIEGPGPDGRALQWDGVEVRGLRPQGGTPGPRMDGIHEPARHRLERSGRGRGAGERRIDHRPLAGRRTRAAATAARAVGNGQAQLPGKVGAQEIRQVGTVRLRGQPLILTGTEVAMQEIAFGVAQHRRQ